MSAVTKLDRAEEIARLRRALEEYQALRDTAVRIGKSFESGVSLRSLSIFAEAKQQIGRRA